MNDKLNNMENHIKIDKRTFSFALQIVDLYKHLVKIKKEFILSKQLLRSGASVGANIEEAQAAQSKKDFISKMSIASKEARETKYWLKLLDESGYLDVYQNKAEIMNEIDSIINIITKIVKTSKKTMKRSRSNE